MPYEIIRFPYDGTIDADGHVLEPAWLWEEYLERASPARDPHPHRRGRARVPRARRAPVRAHAQRRARPDGRDGRPRRRGPGPSAATWTTSRTAPATRSERVELLDREHLEKAVLYPDDRPALGVRGRRIPELTLAYQRAYNRWIADFCRDSGGRLVPIAQLTPARPGGAAARARARRRGRLPRRLRLPVHAHAEAARPSRSRRAVREGVRARRAARDPSRPTSRRGRCRCASTASAARASSSTT